MRQLVGRERESKLLASLHCGDVSSFVALYGRRRVGKTYLVKRAFDDEFDFYLTGMANAGLQHQLANFHASLKKYDLTDEDRAPARSWFEAFQQLIEVLEASSSEKKVIFLDELPWMDTPQSFFIQALEHFWNSWASGRTDILLIVCGSAAAWMISKLINNRGGLHNRLTHRIKLEPFTLGECEQFFRQKSAVYGRYQIIQLYMALGGIPFYLEQVDTGKTPAQNINDLCFNPNGLLRGEFENLYRSLFNKAEKHIAIIETLSKKNKGMTREELIAGAGLSNGGSVTRTLYELEESGFIRNYVSFGKKQKHSLYQLSDFYSFFYLKWIKDSSKLDENIWLSETSSPRQRAWSGYAFEQVCLAHVREIKQALGISGVQTYTCSWLSNVEGNEAQIDLVIDRRDQAINIFEIKFSENSFVIDKKYAQELRNRLSIFIARTGTRKAVFLTMLTTFGLYRNEHAAMVQNELTMDVLFGQRMSEPIQQPARVSIVRQVMAGDEQQILSLYKRVSSHDDGLARRGEEISEEYVGEFMEHARLHGLQFVAEDPDNGKIVGEIHCYKPVPKVFGHILSELTIAVDPAYQGQGVGRALFQAVLMEVKERRRDILRVELIARESNKRAIAFYQSLGFEVEGRLVNRIKAGGAGFEADIPMGWMNPNYLTE